MIRKARDPSNVVEEPEETEEVEAVAEMEVAALCGLFVVFRQAPDWEKPEGWLLKKGEKRSNWTRRWPAPGPSSPKEGACVIGGEGNGFW